MKRVILIIGLLFVGYFEFRSYRIGSQQWKFSKGTPFLGDMAVLCVTTC